jgi:hypothetical protein
VTPRQLHKAIRSLLFTRRTEERLSEVETSLKIYLVQQPTPCVTVGEHQVALVGDQLEVSRWPHEFIALCTSKVSGYKLKRPVSQRRKTGRHHVGGRLDARVALQRCPILPADDGECIMKPEPGRIPVSTAQISDLETLISTGPHVGGRSLVIHSLSVIP